MAPTQELVTFRPIAPDRTLPLLVEPNVADVDLIAWAKANASLLRDKLHRHGGLLFRGFGLTTPEQLTRFIESASSGEWAEYREAATPRSVVSGNVFTSTDYPPDQEIFLHNENSHCTTWPRTIFFCCAVEPREGGATPIADCRRVLAALPEDVRERFRERGWMYVRNFGDGLGFTWQEVFGAETREQVEAYCRANGMTPEWREGGKLRIRYTRPAVQRHPVTGEEIWFNHGTFFHLSTLSDDLREILQADRPADEMPYQTYYGDGGDIEPEVMDILRGAYRDATVAEPWQRGDLLMLDNMLVAHGRQPYAGERLILVGMAEPIGLDSP